MLKLTLASGDVHELQFDETSTVTITNRVLIDGHDVDSALAFSEVVGFELVADPPVEAPEIPVQTPQQAAAEVGGANAAPDTPDGTAGTHVTLDPPDGDQSLLEKVEDKLGFGNPSHDEAVAGAQTAVEVAIAGTADDQAAHLAQAQADLDSALAQYPGSPQLQDAKAQLDAIAGTQGSGA